MVHRGHCASWSFSSLHGSSPFPGRDELQSFTNPANRFAGEFPRCKVVGGHDTEPSGGGDLQYVGVNHAAVVTTLTGPQTFPANFKPTVVLQTLADPWKGMAALEQQGSRLAEWARIGAHPC